MNSSVMKSAVAILLGAICLLIMPVINGKPLPFADTRTYYIIGQKMAETIGIERMARSEVDLAGEAGANVAPSPDREKRGLTVGATRSPYYSFYLFMLERIGGLWLVVALQCLIAAFVVKVFSFAATPTERFKWELYSLNILALTLLSPLPLLTSYMMPDVFTGVGILVAVCLLLYPDRISTLTRAALWLILLFSVLAHSTHVLLMMVLAAAGYVALRAIAQPRRIALRRSGAIAVAGLAGIMASSVYAYSVQVITGERIGSPPFIMARMVADGPGRAYLSAVCAKDEEAYTLCRYKDRDIRSSQDFLWGRDPEKSVFGSADNETRARLSEEQMDFVIGTILFDPVGQLSASAVNFFQQLVNLDLSEYLPDAGATAALYTNPEYALLGRIVPGASGCIRDPDLCVSRLPTNVLRVSIVLGFIATLVGALALAVRRTSGPVRAMDDRQRAVAFLALAGVLLLVNALVCGALSEPVGRYQVRMIWLFPIGFCTLCCLQLVKRPSAIPESRHETEQTVVG